MHLTKLLLILILGAASARAQLITTFGNSAENGGSWTYTSATSTISGTEGFGDLIFGTPDNTGFLPGNTEISLTGNASLVPAGSFNIVLEDASANLAVATFLWSSFTTGPQTVQQELVFTTFDFTNVIGWSLISGGSLQPVSASFSQLSAVPEPASCVLLGLALASLAIARRNVRPD